MLELAKTPAAMAAVWRCTRTGVVWLLALGALGAGSPAVRAESLDRELMARAPQVLQFLKSKGYTNVGLLKFLVKKGNEPTTDNAGSLNLDVAQHLSIALILADDARQSVDIIRDASAVAALLPGANHLTREGRLKLFGQSYPLAWGDRKVKPDAFLTGVVEVSQNLHELTLRLKCIDQTGGVEDVFDRDHLIHAETQSADLVCLGESYILRTGLNKDGEFKVVPADQAVQDALEVRQQKKDFPLMAKDAPVELQIYYDGKKVPYEIRDGKAFIPEPQEKQDVVFRLKRTPSARGRLGVVLKVNGVNTLYKEELSDDWSCRMWVLEPDSGPLTIRGYQTDEGTADKFKVLSRPASKKEEINYGKDLGTITLVVFREIQAGEKAEPAGGETGRRVAVQRGMLPAEPPKNLSALRYQLRHSLNPGIRGIIPREGGGKIQSVTRTVPFDAATQPIMTAVITYYHRQ